MDGAQYDRMVEWVEANVDDHIAKADLVERVHDSQLPQEAKRVFDELPEATLGKEELLGELREISMEKFGLGQSTTMAGKFGGDGIFGE